MRPFIFVPKWLEVIIRCIDFIFRILELGSSRRREEGGGVKCL